MLLSPELRKIMAEGTREIREVAELRRWVEGGRKSVLSSSSKARWLGMVAEHDGLIAAVRTMDTLATHSMPEALQ